MFWFIIKLANKQVARIEKLNAAHETRHSIVGSTSMEFPSGMGSTDGVNVDQHVAQVTAVTTLGSKRAPSFTQKIKILVGFGQIAQHIAFAGDIPWPGTFQAFASAFAIFNFNFLPWDSLQCVAAINHILKTWIVCIVPIGVLLLMLVCMYLPMRYFESKDFSDDLQIEKQ